MDCRHRIGHWALLLILVHSSCFLRSRAIDTLADVLAESEKSYLSDDDPELIAAALPFNLKTIETLLESEPNHRGLLLSATTAFTLYAYGFVEPEAQLAEEEDFRHAETIWLRAANLYRRAFQYGFRGLEVHHPGFGENLRREPKTAVSTLKKEDVPLAVWTASALGSAIGILQDDPEMTADIMAVGTLLERALELDEGFEEGTIHELLVNYEAQRVGGSMEKAREYYRRASELSKGRRCSIWLTWAENISISEQNRQEFEEMMERILAFDVSSSPEYRLMNLLTQRRARSLQERIDELFLE